MTEKVKSVFDELSGIDVNEHKEEKNGLSYLSWSWAWAELQKRYPDASYTIEKFGELKSRTYTMKTPDTWFLQP